MGLSAELQVSTPKLSAHQQVCPKVGCAMISQCSFVLVSLYPVEPQASSQTLPSRLWSSQSVQNDPHQPVKGVPRWGNISSFTAPSHSTSSFPFFLHPTWLYHGLSCSLCGMISSVIFLSVLWELFHMYMYFLLYVWDEVSSQPSTLPSWSPPISPGFS